MILNQAMDVKGDQSLKSLTIVESNFGESSAVSDSDSDSTFEESFASRTYAGSFRLRYSASDKSVRRGKESTIIGDKLALDSSAAAHPLSFIEEIEQQKTTPKQMTAVDSQQFSLNFTEAQGKHLLYESLRGSLRQHAF